MPRVRELTTNRRIIDVRKQRDDVKVCITLAIPGETEKTEITHTKKSDFRFRTNLNTRTLQRPVRRVYDLEE